MAELKKVRNNPKFTTFKDLVEKSIYKIPYYQRNYSWSKDNVSSLLESIEDFYKKAEVEYKLNFKEHYFNYIGPIVILLNDDFSKEIIDGQQRITTLFLVIAYIKNQLKLLRQKLKSENYLLLQEEITLTIGEYEDLILSSKRLTTILKRIHNQESKIKLNHYNDNDKEDFRCILTNDKISDIRKSSVIKKNYKIIASYFEEKFKELKLNDQKENDIAKISQLLINYGDILIHYTNFLYIEIDDMGNAFNIFETMNNTGISLKPFDLINGYIQKQLKDSKEQEAQEILKKYNEIITKIHKENNILANKYAFHWINSIKNNEVSNFILFSEIKKYIKDIKNDDFFNKINNLINSFKKLDKYLNSNINYIGKLINWLDRSKIIPLLLLLENKNYSLQESNDIMLKTIKYSIIELNLLGKSPGNFQYRIKEIMKFISENEKKVTFDEIVEKIQNIKRDINFYKDNDIFERFSNFEILDYNLNKSLLLLLFINEFETHTKLDFEYIDGEHGFPKKPTEEWWNKEVWKNIKNDSDKVNKFKNCIGNIKLINKRTNQQASNYSSSKKESIINESSKENDPLNNQDFNKIDYNNLSPNYIEKRHKEIVELLKEKNIFKLM